MAEGVGFEPTKSFHSCRFSRPVQSTTLPPLRGAQEYRKSGLCSSLDLVCRRPPCGRMIVLPQPSRARRAPTGRPSRARRALCREKVRPGTGREAGLGHAPVPRRPWKAGSGLLQTFSMPGRKKQSPATKWELEAGADVSIFGRAGSYIFRYHEHSWRT